MKILVTGGGGFAGRHLLRQLPGRGSAEVWATLLGPIPTGAADDLDGVCWLSMDILAEASIREVVERVQPDQIYHLAGQASVGQSFEDPVLTWEVNATGTLRLLAALSELPAAPRRMLLISSAEVYGAVETAVQPIREDAPMRPITPYGASKAAAEIAAFQMGASAGVEVVVARSFNHIGPGQDDRFVLPSVARQLARLGEGERTLSVGNLEVERDFLDVRDVARAYIALMASGERGTAYNVCSGVGRTLLSVVERLVDLSGTGARLIVDPERVRAVDIPRLVGDAERLRSLGWNPTTALDATLVDLLREAAARA